MAWPMSAGSRARAGRAAARRQSRAEFRGRRRSAPSNALSVASCRISRSRPAPSAVRTASSWRRPSARVSNRLTRLAQTMSITQTAAPLSASTIVRDPPESSSWSGFSVAPVFSFSFGYWRMNRFAITVSSVRAEASGRARSQSPDRAKVGVVPVGEGLVVEHQRQPQLRPLGREAELPAHDADDRDRAVVERDLAADDAVVGAEERAPEAIAQDDGGWSTLTVVTFGERAAECRAHAKRWKHRGTHRGSFQPLGFAGTDEIDRHVGEGADAFERGRGLGPVPVIRGRELHARVAAHVLPQRDQPLGFEEWQWPEQDEVGDRERGRIGADPQRDDGYGGGGETARSVQRSDRIAKILLEDVAVDRECIPDASHRRHRSRVRHGRIRCSRRAGAGGRWPPSPRRTRRETTLDRDGAVRGRGALRLPRREPARARELDHPRQSSGFGHGDQTAERRQPVVASALVVQVRRRPGGDFA